MLRASVAVLLPVAAAFAQQQGPEITAADQRLAAQSAPYQQFLAGHPGVWWSHWCEATGTPKGIYGVGVDLADWRGDTAEEAQRQAWIQLQAHRELLGLGDADLRLVTAARMGNAWAFTWAQHHRGVPVLGGRADIRIHGVGRLSFLGSTIVPMPADFDTTPRLDEARATAIAFAALGTDVRPTVVPGAAKAPRLVVFADLEGHAAARPTLAYEVPVAAVTADGEGPVGRYYIDAHTGAVLHWRNDKHECGFDHAHGHADPGGEAPAQPAPAVYTLRGYARDGVSCLTPGTLVPLPGIEIQIPGVGSVVTDANGQFQANLAAATTVTVRMDGVHHVLVASSSQIATNFVLQPSVDQDLTLLLPTATATELAQTTTSLWVHRVNEWARSILGNSPELATADAVVPTVNIASTCNAYYTNNTINFYAAGGGCANTASSSIVMHEWGHGLDDRYGGISQVHGLSEGWGDIISMYALDYPLVGDGMMGPIGNGLRTGLNNRQYPPPTEVHDAGEVFMGFAWLFRQNLRQALGDAQAIAISNRVVVGSMPANAGDQPSAIVQVFLADDDDGNLVNGTPHYAQLQPACTAHNLPYPAIQAGVVIAGTLGDTNFQFTPRRVTARAIPTAGLGYFSSVTLFWNDGTAHSRQMLFDGNPDEYQALLPGVMAPRTITWHVEAQHSSNVLMRAPATGEYSFDVRAEMRLAFEDFETGAVGWTHGAVTGVDEWVIGAPQGLSGTGWSDPAAAWRGSNCAGTDLAWNGSYENNSEIWLRSPMYDFSVYSGVHLRYRRWLSVDAGVRDVAQIKLGNTVVWSNSTTTAMNDGAWVSHDILIPGASNNPAVTLEFRLRTDASGVFGGWNLDDFELYTTTLPVPLTYSLEIAPEQVQVGLPVVLTVLTPAQAPFVLFFGLTPGPTMFPGAPELQVGTILGNMFGMTDANGGFQIAFPVPAGLPATGLLWYSQVLTFDSSWQFVATNPSVNLFTL